MGLTVVLMCETNAVELGLAVTELKVINGEAFFTPRKKYCECDVM
jgi:hypothetical protein